MNKVKVKSNYMINYLINQPNPATNMTNSFM